MNKGNSKKIIIICIVCALLGGVLIGGVGVMIYNDLSQRKMIKQRIYPRVPTAAQRQTSLRMEKHMTLKRLGL